MIEHFSNEKAPLKKLSIFGLIVVLLAFSTSTVVYAQEPFSHRSLKVEIYADGVVSIDYSLDVDTTYNTINVPLFGTDFENIIVLNHLGETLDYEPIEAGIKIHTLGTYRVRIMYETRDLTIESGGGFWTFGIDSPINVTIVLPRDAGIISFSRSPISIDIIKDKTLLTMLAGDLELVYAIIVSVPVPVSPEIPGVPSGAIAYDHRGIVPVDFFRSIPADTPTVLVFKNFLLIVNSTERLDLGLTVGSGVVMKYFLLRLEPGESLSLDINVNVSPPSGVVALDNDIDIYVDVTTVSVKAALGLYVNETALEADLGRDIDDSRLTWMYWDGSEWILMPSDIDANGYLIASTTRFSTWTIVEIVPLQVAAQLSPQTVTPGDAVTISSVVKDDAGNSIEGATVTATIGDKTINLSDQGNGNYQGTIDTSDFKEGTYDVVVTAQKVGYRSAQTSESLTAEAKPAETPWMLYGGIAAISIVIIAAVLYKIKKRP